MKEFHTLNPTKMKKTNEQLLEQCREELLKEAKELEHIRQRTEKQDSRLVEIWNQFEQQAALLALQRQSEAHDREMEGFVKITEVEGLFYCPPESPRLTGMQDGLEINAASCADCSIFILIGDRNFMIESKEAMQKAYDITKFRKDDERT